MASQPPPPSSSDTTSPGRFTSRGTTAQDLLASQTVGLVNLSDFRKRRAEALEQKDREASNLGRFTPSKTAGSRSGTATPSGNGEGVTTPIERPKKKRKPVVKGKLSFGIEDEDQDNGTDSKATSTAPTPQSTTPNRSARASPAPEKRRLGPNTNVSIAPRALTKSALRTESETREALRRDFLLMQEAVRATEIIIPFVFYDGTNIPGGICKIRKGDHIWLFLDRARKLGAQSGVNAAGEKGGGSRRDWARVGVDDLILVRGEIIIPHRYEIYHFLLNKVCGPDSTPLFNYAATTSTKTPANTLSAGAANGDNDEREGDDDGDDNDTYNPLSHSTAASKLKSKPNGVVTAADRKTLEGGNDDPNFTKVVDRRWYERNKHIFPASVWEEYDPEKTIEGKVRTDAQGNAFFFS